MPDHLPVAGCRVFARRCQGAAAVRSFRRFGPRKLRNRLEIAQAQAAEVRKVQPANARDVAERVAAHVAIGRRIGHFAYANAVENNPDCAIKHRIPLYRAIGAKLIADPMQTRRNFIGNVATGLRQPGYRKCVGSERADTHRRDWRWRTRDATGARGRRLPGYGTRRLRRHLHAPPRRREKLARRRAVHMPIFARCSTTSRLTLSLLPRRTICMPTASSPHLMPGSTSIRKRPWRSRWRTLSSCARRMSAPGKRAVQIGHQRAHRDRWRTRGIIWPAAALAK